jgi:SacI-like restriction endonuclease
MPIQLNYDAARQRFEEALQLATSDSRLPDEWAERTRKVGAAPSKTFTAMLGTALLAKATNRRVDPLALKARDIPNAYNARSLCKDVLVPLSVRAGVNLGTTGREPLNNQPFFRHERVGPDMKLHPNTRAHLDYLTESLGRLEPLDEDASLLALAAFLRVRLREAPQPVALELGQLILGVDELERALFDFTTANPEGGKRGQAFVAAAFDLVFTDVRTRRVNDPGRHWPGDVVALRDRSVFLTAEVKQRPATDTEIRQFVDRSRKSGIARAVVALLDPSQPALRIEELRIDSWQRSGVHLSVLTGAADVLRAALTWTALPLEEALALFPKLMADRLRELEVSSDGQVEWISRFSEAQRG